MSKSFRRRIFFLLVVLFLLGAPAIFLYSAGLRLALKNWQVVQTGAIFIKALPNKVQISVDQATYKSDLFFGSALIENILPGSHQVVIGKDGFQNWQKNLAVQPRQVSEAKDVILFKTNYQFNQLATNLSRVFVNDNGQLALLLEQEPTSGAKQLKLLNLGANIKSQLAVAADFKVTDLDIFAASFSKSAEQAIVAVARKEQLAFFLVGLSGQLTPPKELTFLPQDTEAVYFQANDSDDLVVVRATTENRFNVHAANLTRRTLQQLPLVSAATLLTVTEQGIFWLDARGLTFRTSFGDNRTTRLSDQPFELVQGELPISLELHNNVLTLSQGGQSYWLQLNEQSGWQSPRTNLSAIIPSAAGDKLALQSEHELWVMFLKAQAGQPARTVNEQVFLTRLSRQIGQVWWLNENYLLLTAGSDLLVVELDNRDQVQLWTIASFPEPKITFDAKARQLGVVSSDKWLLSEPLY